MKKQAQSNAWAVFLESTEKLSLKELELWFDLLLTRAEQADISDRIEILRGLLKDEEPQRALSDHLGVSISKITRGSNALREMSAQKKAWLKALLG